MNPNGTGHSSFFINSAILMKRFSFPFPVAEALILLEPRN